MGNILKIADRGPTSVGLKFENEFKHKTKTGALISLIILGFALLLAIIIIRTVVDKKEIITKETKMTDVLASNVSIPVGKKMVFAIGVQQMDLRYEKIFRFKLRRTSYVTKERNITEVVPSQEEIELVPCTLKNWIQNDLQKYYYELEIYKMLCINQTQFLNLTDVSGYRFQVEKCSPESPKPPGDLKGFLNESFNNASIYGKDWENYNSQKYDIVYYDKADYSKDIVYIPPTTPQNWSLYTAESVQNQLTCALPNCFTCDKTGNICTYCNIGFAPNFNGICVPTSYNCSITNCMYCFAPDSTCITCGTGYTPSVSGTVCVPRCKDTNCRLCDENGLNCTQCFVQSVFALNGNRTCMKTQIGNCQTKISNCMTCYTDGSICTECYTGYTIDIKGTSCLTRCKDSNCRLCNDQGQNCTKCFPGSVFSQNGTCMKTSFACSMKNCVQCYTVGSYCTYCSSGYIADSNGVCVSICKDPNCGSCDITGSTCSQCVYGYSKNNNGTCMKTTNDCTISNCFECFTAQSYQFCRQCYYGNTLQQDGTCAPICYDTNCKNCFYSRYWCDVCSQGFTLEYGDCIKSQPYCSVVNCVTCNNDPTICQLCSDSYTLSSSNTCDQINPAPCTVANCDQCQAGSDSVCATCSVGYGLQFGSCWQCTVQDCATCDNDPTICSQCSDSYTLSSSNTCDQINPAPCTVANCDQCQAGSDSVCATCSVGYGLQFGSCWQCTVQDCATCDNDPTICQLCSDSYTLSSSNTCDQINPAPCTVANCDQCQAGSDSVCATCSVGYGLQFGSCWQCTVQDCATCDNDPTICSQCSDSYTLSSSNTCDQINPAPCTVANCDQCQAGSDSVCATCSVGYGLQFGSCWQCTVQDCATCDNDPTICSQCSDSYTLSSSNTCDQINPAPCTVANCDQCQADSDSVCATCSVGYGLQFGSCWQCTVQDCATCDNDPTICSQCSDSYTLSSSNTCDQINPAPCTVANCDQCQAGSDSVCATCSVGYGLQFGSCWQCTVQDCATCDNDPTICSQCSDSYTLSSSNTCDQINPAPCTVANCDQCQAGSDSVCATCSVGYGLQFGSCWQCTVQDCATCDNDPTICSQCSDSYTLSPSGTCDFDTNLNSPSVGSIKLGQTPSTQSATPTAYKDLPCYYEAYNNYFGLPRKYTLQFYHLDTFINAKNPSFVQQYVHSRQFNLQLRSDAILRYDADISIASYDVTTNNNLAWTNQIESFMERKRGLIVLDDMKKAVYLYSQGSNSSVQNAVADEMNNFLTIDISRSSVNLSVYRRYKNIVEALGELGGLLSFLFLILGILIGGYNEFSYNIELSKQLYYNKKNQPLQIQANIKTYLVHFFWPIIKHLPCRKNSKQKSDEEHPQASKSIDQNRQVSKSEQIEKIYQRSSVALDIKQTLQKINNLEKACMAILGQKMFQAIYFQQPTDMEKLQETHEMSQMHKILIEQYVQKRPDEQKKLSNQNNNWITSKLDPSQSLTATHLKSENEISQQHMSNSEKIERQKRIKAEITFTDALKEVKEKAMQNDPIAIRILKDIDDRLKNIDFPKSSLHLMDSQQMLKKQDIL